MFLNNILVSNMTLYHFSSLLRYISPSTGNVFFMSCAAMRADLGLGFVGILRWSCVLKIALKILHATIILPSTSSQLNWR